MKKDLNKKLDEKKVCSKADIVGETYNDIMSKDPKDNLDIEIQQNNELLNPDPNSMDSRG